MCMKQRKKHSHVAKFRITLSVRLHQLDQKDVWEGLATGQKSIINIAFQLGQEVHPIQHYHLSRTTGVLILYSNSHHSTSKTLVDIAKHCSLRGCTFLRPAAFGRPLDGKKRLAARKEASGRYQEGCTGRKEEVKNIKGLYLKGINTNRK